MPKLKLKQELRLLAILVVSWLALTMSSATMADAIADLDLHFIEATDETAAVLCFDDEGHDCATWAKHSLWDARLRRHIEGDKLPKRFKVLFGRHALLHGNFHLKHAKVLEAKGRQSTLAPYVIIEAEQMEMSPHTPREHGPRN